MRTQRGFSLVELLIVVAVIGIIAAIAIPSLLAARRRARESAAIGTLRSYVTAQVTYQSTRGGYSFFGTSADLATGFFDPNLLSFGTRNGYRYTFTLPTPGTFVANADPTQATDPDIRHFYTDSSGVIRYRYPPGPATSADSVIPQ